MARWQLKFSSTYHPGTSNFTTFLALILFCSLFVTANSENIFYFFLGMRSSCEVIIYIDLAQALKGENLPVHHTFSALIITVQINPATLLIIRFLFHLGR